MKLQILIFSVVLWLCFSGCGESKLTNIAPEEINALLAKVNEEDPKFVEKGVSFDSIVTKAGRRSFKDTEQRVKIKLYYFNDRVRGYFNVIDQDDKNHQVFGQLVEEKWVIKCVTKLDAQEVGGYLILDSQGKGIWSNGHLDYKPDEVTLINNDIDYLELNQW